MIKGWAFVAHHVARQRFCIVMSSSNSDVLVDNLVKTLRILGYFDRILTWEETYDIECWRQPTAKPLVVFKPTFQNSYFFQWWTLYTKWWSRDFEMPESPCIVICVCRLLIRKVSSDMFNRMGCILWDKFFSVNMTRFALRCNMIQTFMSQDRQALVKNHGTVFCMEHSNMCCSVDLDADQGAQLGLRAIVKAQQRFRQRRTKAIVIQRAVKKWLQYNTV